MASLVQRLRLWLADESVVYECRNCGKNLDEHKDSCHACGADDIARYDFD